MTKVLKVLGLPIKVTFSPRSAPSAFLGQYNSLDSTIWVDNSRQIEEAAETLMHEIIHAVQRANGIDLKEREAHALARGLFAVFEDNGLNEPLKEFCREA